MLEVRLKARCLPTEDREKVVRAITSLFPEATIEGDDPIVATSASLDMFGELLKRQRIRDAARHVLRHGMHGNSATFRLNKQVAAVGRISFSLEEHPLGDIEVTIYSDNLEALVDEIAPSTRKEAGR